MNEYMLSEHIKEMKLLLNEVGDLPIYMFDEYDRAGGQNEFVGFTVLEKENKPPYRPKRIEFE